MGRSMPEFGSGRAVKFSYTRARCLGVVEVLGAGGAGVFNR